MSDAAPPTRPARHANSFDALRLAAASAVIMGHAFPLTGRSSVYVAGFGLHASGVLIFFAISGYLITRSWSNDPHLGRFWRKRALRIMPALAMVVALTTFVIGPIVSSAPPGAYFGSVVTWRYLAENLVLWTDHTLPGVFTTLPYPYSVNTSLWTLPIEVCLYASTLIAVSFYVRFGRYAWAAMMALAFTSALLWDRNPYALHRLFDAKLYSFRLYDALGYLLTYLLGSVFAVMRLDRVTRTTARAATVAALAVLALALVVPPPFALTLAILPVTVATLYIGLGRTFDLAFLRRIGDISYGTYLWGFLVQQSVIWLAGPKIGPWGDAAISLPVAWTLGFASWHLVERPMLQYKRGPRLRVPSPVQAASTPPDQNLSS